MPLALQAEMLVCNAFVVGQWHKVLDVPFHHLVDRLRAPFHFFARIWIGCVAFAVVVDSSYLDRATARHKLRSLIGIVELPVEVVYAGSRIAIRNGSDRSIGSAETSGNRTTFRDASGRSIGSASSSGTRTTFRDRSGRSWGSASSNRR